MPIQVQVQRHFADSMKLHRESGNLRHERVRVKLHVIVIGGDARTANWQRSCASEDRWVSGKKLVTTV